MLAAEANPCVPAQEERKAGPGAGWEVLVPWLRQQQPCHPPAKQRRMWLCSLSFQFSERFCRALHSFPEVHSSAGLADTEQMVKAGFTDQVLR